jgi:hypothetical protein
MDEKQRAIAFPQKRKEHKENKAKAREKAKRVYGGIKCIWVP